MITTDQALTRMLLDWGPLAEINFGDAPVHYNPGLPFGNKGVDWETGVMLHNFVRKYKPETIVELGTFRGYSTSWLLLGAMINEMGHVHAFEVFNEGYYGRQWYDTYELDKTKLTYHEIPGGIWNFPKDIPGKIDLLYHDTEHSVNPTQIELSILLPRIPVGGIVLVDDMRHPDYGPMQDVVEGAFADPKTWKYSVLTLGHGLGIARRLK